MSAFLSSVLAGLSGRAASFPLAPESARVWLGAFAREVKRRSSGLGEDSTPVRKEAFKKEDLPLIACQHLAKAAFPSPTWTPLGGRGPCQAWRGWALGARTYLRLSEFVAVSPNIRPAARSAEPGPGDGSRDARAVGGGVCSPRRVGTGKQWSGTAACVQ